MFLFISNSFPCVTLNATLHTKKNSCFSRWDVVVEHSLVSKLGGEMLSSGIHNRSRLQGHHSAVGMGDQGLVVGIAVRRNSTGEVTEGLCLTLLLAVQVAVAIVGAMQVRVVWDEGAVGVAHQAGIGLSLAQVVGAVVVRHVHGRGILGGQVGVGGSLAGIADNTNENQIVDHGGKFSPECAPC